MTRFLAAAATALLGLSLCAGTAVAEEYDPTQGVTIALIDSGINPEHQEFAPDQLIGYWDFTKSPAPAVGPRFDPVNEPADDSGDGTLAASLAVGLNVNPSKTRSYAPGFRYAVADVVEAGAVTGDISAAIRWALRTINADVIYISTESMAPTPGAPLLFEEYVALQEAQDAGVLVVVGNGNGLANSGQLPSDGASSTYSSSNEALAVGAAGPQGAQVSWQPEVAAQYAVTGAAGTAPAAYRSAASTSFSAAIVVGYAARLVAEARSVGRVIEGIDLEWLVKYTVTDTDQPPMWEGYGVVDDAALAFALGHARQGTLPAYNNVSGLYVEEVTDAERDVNEGQPQLPGNCVSSNKTRC